MMTHRSCKDNCRYRAGAFCTYRAPTLITIDDQPYTIWPQVPAGMPDAWACGDHAFDHLQNMPIAPALADNVLAMVQPGQDDRQEAPGQANGVLRLAKPAKREARPRAPRESDQDQSFERGLNGCRGADLKTPCDNTKQKTADYCPECTMALGLIDAKQARQKRYQVDSDVRLGKIVKVKERPPSSLARRSKAKGKTQINKYGDHGLNHPRRCKAIGTTKDPSKRCGQWSEPGFQTCRFHASYRANLPVWSKDGETFARFSDES